MSGSAVFRWLLPAAVAALLTIPLQTAGASPMGGGGHGGMGGGHAMGGMGRGGFGGRGMMMRNRSPMGSRFFSRNGTNGFGSHQNLASQNHNFNRFNGRGDRSLDRRDQFRDSHGLADRGIDRADRFRDNRFGRFDRDDRFGRFDRDDRRFFFGHNFFVGFNFGAFGWWPGWWGWGWGGPWWWGWDGWAYPYAYSDYGYPYGYTYDDPPASDSQYGSKEYWSDLAMSVQTKLANDGYYHGQIDGTLSSDTLEAIRQFQSDHGLTVSGKIDPKLLDALGIQYNKQAGLQSAEADRS